MVAIIEITGVPGVGKTTIANALTKICGKNWYVYTDKMVLERIGLADIPFVFTRLIQDLILIIYCFRASTDGLGFLIYAAKVLSRQTSSFRLKCKIFGNIIRKIGRLQYIRAHFGAVNVILDEGIGHIPFNLQSYECGNINDCVTGVYENSKNLIRGNVLVVLDGGDIDECERLMRRGHARTLGKSPEWIKRFCSVNQAVVESIRTEAKGFYREVRVVNIGEISLHDCASIICR